MGKNFKFLRFFTLRYWERRVHLMKKWNSRKTSIKHLFINGKRIERSIVPEYMKKYNELFQEYNQGCKAINSIHENQRIINSLELIH